MSFVDWNINLERPIAIVYFTATVSSEQEWSIFKKIAWKIEFMIYKAMINAVDIHRKAKVFIR